jgi:hypothetical protein
LVTAPENLEKCCLHRPYFFLDGAAAVLELVRPAVARTFGFSFLGFLASLLDFI